MVTKRNFHFVSSPTQEKKLFTFCALTFEPIEVQNRSAPQNDRLNLSFVKDFHLVGEKWQEIVGKRPFISSKFWATVSSTYIKVILKNHFIGDAGSATASVNVCQSPARTCSRTSSKKSNQSTLISNGKGTYV